MTPVLHARHSQVCMIATSPWSRLLVAQRVHKMRCTRAVHISALLLPPLIFTGLALALYAWKCFMLVLFQNKIIYNPGLPPFARFEKIEEYAGTCGGVRWSEDSIRAEDGTRLAIALSSLYVSPGKPGDRLAAAPYAAHIYVLYLQGT